MNKTIAIIIVLLVSIAFIAGISVMAINSDGGGWPWNWHFNWNWDWSDSNGERADVDESAALSAEGITQVDISLPFGNVNVSVEAGEPGVELKGHFNVIEKKDKYLFVTAEDGTLSIEFDPGRTPRSQNSNIEMTIRLPQDIAAGLKLKNSSGNVMITGGNFTGIVAKCQSGNIRIENINGPVNAQCSSGNIYISAVSGTVYAKNSSGNIDIDISGKEVSQITATLSSGNVNLYLDPQAAFTLDAKTSSGNIACDFDILVSGGTDRGRLKGDVGGGGAAVELKTNSGNVNVYKR